MPITFYVRRFTVINYINMMIYNRVPDDIDRGITFTAENTGAPRRRVILLLPGYYK